MTNDDLPPLLAYRDALDDELVTIESAVESFSTPKAALEALIDWHVSVALDPKVSSDAQKLIDDARAPLLAEIERLRACIADVRQSAKSVLAYRRSDDYSRGVRAQAVYTLAILDGHAAVGDNNDR